jgi:hypothetical protein
MSGAFPGHAMILPLDQVAEGYRDGRASLDQYAAASPFKKRQEIKGRIKGKQS